MPPTVEPLPCCLPVTCRKSATISFPDPAVCGATATGAIAGKKLTGQPVFVLTSKRTFSGAEEFTYNLKNLKRATIAGETTGGGAHPVSGHRIDDHFMIGVPFARAVNPISKTNC